MAWIPVGEFSVGAQVYGVAKNTTVVSGPNGTVAVSKTTVVAGGTALSHGYIAVLPGGYRAVTVSGALLHCGGYLLPPANVPGPHRVCSSPPLV
jgi:hypothetical protein